MENQQYSRTKQKKTGPKKFYKRKNRNVQSSALTSEKDCQNIGTSCTLCTLCKDHNVEIYMPCAGMHAYCFSCIKKWLASKKDLSCPECRKSCNSIIKMPIPKDKLSNEFNKFLDSVKIIPHPLKHDDDCKCFQSYFDNTCIYPDWSLIHFIENKEQLELYHEIIENPKYKDKIDKLVKLIKWYIHNDDEKITHHSHHSHHSE